MSNIDQYDASEQEDRASSHYLDRKDVKIIGIVLVVFLLITFPIYRHLVGDAEAHVCQNNMGQIMKAVNLYALDNNDRFPVVAVADAEGNPYIFNGSVNTWMTQVKGYMSKKVSTVCPSSSKEEYVQNEDAEGTTFFSTYAMYQPYSGVEMSRVKNPGQTVLIVESTNNGAMGSYDPSPLTTVEKKPSPYDGYVIGWDKTEWVPQGPELVARPSIDAKAVTRLPFYEVKNGAFSDETNMRHGKGINAIMANGTLRHLKSAKAAFLIRGSSKTNEVSGLWATD